MKKLIRTILKETIDNRIVDLIKKMGLTNYIDIRNFLEEIGYSSDEINNIYKEWFESITGSDLTPMNWMNYYFNPDQLESYIEGNTIFYSKNNVNVMYEHIKFKAFWFDYDEIWSFFEMFFDMNFEEITKFLGEWLKNTFNKDYSVSVSSNN